MDVRRMAMPIASGVSMKPWMVRLPACVKAQHRNYLVADLSACFEIWANGANTGRHVALGQDALGIEFGSVW